MKSLEERVHVDSTSVLTCQVPQLLGNITKSGHLVIIGEVPEKNFACRHHVQIVLEKPCFIHVKLVNFALRTILFDEPVVTQGFRILLTRDPNEFGRLGLEALQLTWPDLDVGVQFEMTHKPLLETGKVCAPAITGFSDGRHGPRLRANRIIRGLMPIDSYRFLDYATRQIIKAWVQRETQTARSIPWAPLTKPLSRCTVALLSTAGVACNDDKPFDQEGERQNPWWGDPSYRLIPLGATEKDVRLYNMHIDTRFGEADLDVVLPMRRLQELASEGTIGQPAHVHFSIVGYQLRPDVLENETAPAIARELETHGVDAAALIPV